MPQTLILIFFGIIIFGGIGYILYRQALKFFTGTLKIKNIDACYNFRGNITPKIEFHAKKDLEVLSLELHLVGYYRDFIPTPKGRISRQIELSRSTQVIPTKNNYQAGEREVFEAHIELPKAYEYEQLRQELPSSMKNKKIRWKLRADMHTQNIDLTSSQTLFLKSTESF